MHCNCTPIKCGLYHQHNTSNQVLRQTAYDTRSHCYGTQSLKIKVISDDIVISDHNIEHGCTIIVATSAAVSIRHWSGVCLSVCPVCHIRHHPYTDNQVQQMHDKQHILELTHHGAVLNTTSTCSGSSICTTAEYISSLCTRRIMVIMKAW